MKTLYRTLWLSLLLWALPFSAAQADRIKDLTSMAAMRGNQLIGYGLVVGLQGTGDKKASFTSQSMKTLLNRMGLNQENDLDKFTNAISSGGDELANVAAVMITADLPGMAKPGQRIVLHCRSGKRSITALGLAQDSGRMDIRAHFTGGMLEWAGAGEQVLTG